jgi:hypothetical protein
MSIDDHECVPQTRTLASLERDVYTEDQMIHVLDASMGRGSRHAGDHLADLECLVRSSPPARATGFIGPGVLCVAPAIRMRAGAVRHFRLREIPERRMSIDSLDHFRESFEHRSPYWCDTVPEDDSAPVHDHNGFCLIVLLCGDYFFKGNWANRVGRPLVENAERERAIFPRP